MPKVLITGGAGFIGTNLVEGLLPFHRLVVVDNLSTGKRANLWAGVKFYEADVTGADFEKIIAAEKPEIIVHLAAQAKVAVSVQNPFFDLQSNIIGTLKVIETARAYGVRKVIYASSAAVYGNPQFLPITEQHPVAPLSPYGITKHTPEHYLQVYSENYGLKYTILRFANVYGPRQDAGGEGGVVAIFTDRLLRDEPLTIFGDGEQTRDFVFVKDVARAITMAFNDGDNQIYNVGSGQKVSINALLHQLQTLTGKNAEPQFLPDRSGDIRHSLFDISKIKNGIKWEPQTALGDGLKATIKGFTVPDYNKR